MQKKLIALAVASVLAAPLAAQAGVEVYGQARMSLDFNSNNDPAPANKDSAIAVSSNKSRLGFRGDEDLGGGLKAMWQIEQDVGFDTGTFSNGARDTFLGLGGNFGTVLAGKLSTPYRTATERLDVFMDTKADYNAIIGSAGSSSSNLLRTSDTNVGNLRTDNTIAYLSPNINGFQGALAYVTNYSGDSLPMTTAAGEKDAFSLSGSYTQGPLFVAAAYEVLNKAGLGGGTSVDDATSMKLGGSFDLGQGTVLGAVFENMDLGGTTGDRNAWYLSGMHTMGDVNLKVAYAAANEWSGVGQANTGATQVSLGAGYNLSKATEAYALYTQVSNDASGGYGLESIAGYADKDVSSFSLGLKHKFSSK